MTLIGIGVILIISAEILMDGNIALAILAERARRFLQSATSLRRINIISGLLLIVTGVLIPFT